MALLAFPALAQETCAPRPVIVDKLARDYKETVTVVGLANNGAIVEVLTSKGGHTWSIIMTYPTGISCAIAFGEHWQPMRVVRGVDG